MTDIKRRQFLQLVGAGVARAMVPAAVLSTKSEAIDTPYFSPDGIVYYDPAQMIEEKKGAYIYNEAKKEILSGPSAHADLHAQLLAEPPIFRAWCKTMRQVKNMNIFVADPTPVVFDGSNCGACYHDLEFLAVDSDLQIGGVVVYSEHSQVPFVFVPLAPLTPNGGDVFIQWEEGLIKIED